MSRALGLAVLLAACGGEEAPAPTDAGAPDLTPAACDRPAAPPAIASLDALRASVLSLRAAWRFRAGDDQTVWAATGFDDSAWETLDAGRTWEAQGHAGYDGVAWYRKRVMVPASWQGSRVRLVANGVDDEYDVFVNGQLVKHHGERPSRSVWGWRTETRIESQLVYGQENTIAVRVTDWGGGGGLWRDVWLKQEVSLDPYRDYLPWPVLDGSPEWVTLYELAWRLALQKISFGTPQNGLRAVYLDEGFNEQIYQWDSSFMALYARYGARLLPPLAALDNFYDRQRADGYIQRVYSETDGSALGEPTADEPMVNPPLFAWAELLWLRTSGDRSRLAEVVPKLERYFGWLEDHVRAPEGRGLYYQSELGSGMDNTPRGDAARAAWVDMSMQQALAARSLAELSRALGDAQRVARWEAKHAALRTDIDRLLWNEADGFYYDLERSGSHAYVKHLGAFWALVAGVADGTRAARLVEHLRDPREFYRPHLFPSLAASDPRYSAGGHYWRGGVWAPTNYMVVRGLAEAGFGDLAREAAENHLGRLAAVAANAPDESRVSPEERDGDYATLWECYSPEQMAPGTRWDAQYLCRQDFVGWTGLGPIAMLLETVIGLDVLGAERRVVWTVTRRDRHGVRNLTVGDGVVDLVLAARASEDAPLEIAITATRAFVLEVRRTGRAPVVRELCAGTTNLTL
jgi:hypothetical protein